ncbi:MAG: SIR2 family protein [Chitinophagaceae bacterium]|jgi:hypothetical protein
MEKRKIEDLAYIFNKVKNDDSLPKPIVLLGAGASVSAGIPNAETIAKKILADFSDKPAIQRLTVEEQKDYYHLMSALSADERRCLFLNYINSDDVKLNVTHIYLAQLIKEGLIDYVFTPNFDDLLLRACALFNYIPPVYDISNFDDFTTTNFQNRSITYLHGQHHGQWLLNAKGELEKIKDIIPKLFNRVCDKRTWIIVGYSGNDELLDVLVKFESFDNELYWIGFKDYEPIQKVKDKLLDVNQKNSFLVSGYDSDSFFLKLHAQLKLGTPEIFNKPFTFLNSIVENIKDIDHYLTEDNHKEEFDIVNVRFSNSKEMIKKAILEIENDEVNKIIQEIIEAIVKKDFSNTRDIFEKTRILNDPKLNVACSKLYNDWAIDLYHKNELNDFRLTCEICIEKYKIAIDLNAQNGLSYNNWGTVLTKLAKLESNDTFLEEAMKKFEICTKIFPNYHGAYFNWGLILTHLGNKLKNINLYYKGFEKIEIGTQFNPGDEGLFTNWSSHLIYAYHLEENPDRKSELLKFALEKSKILYNFSGQGYNLACANALLQNKEEAFHYLNESLNFNQISKAHILSDDDWSNYLNDSTFLEIVNKY